ncbi:FixH family protein [Streptomyces fagopyri]|uniref:FixH family protein n=1 Tax=Streptomyces fagopyri TaxID=2662397 RepID=UPI001D1790B1|nr:FixH family protein [Streptomyces fagopyri]
MRRRAVAAAGTAVALALTLAACGSSGDSSSMPGMDHDTKASASSSRSASPSMGDMPGMDHMADGNGLSDTQDGYRLASKDTTLPSGKRAAYRFTVTGTGDKPVTGFALDQTKRMHFYAIRSDLTGFQHIHPTMAPDGTWTADLTALAPGSWRTFAGFTPDSGTGKGRDFVLSRTVTVPGNATKTPLPAPATTAEVDGYTVTVKGEPMAGMAHPLGVSVSKDGKPVTGLEPYLNTYAHLTAFHEGNQEFAHLHPTTKVTGGNGGPDLAFHAELPTAGNWRLFLQFRTGGTLHTAALTLHVG